MHKPQPDHWDYVLVGVLIALTEIDRAGEETLYDQIVRDVDEVGLVRMARQRGELRFTGMSRYLRDKRNREQKFRSELL